MINQQPSQKLSHKWRFPLPWGLPPSSRHGAWRLSTEPMTTGDPQFQDFNDWKKAGAPGGPWISTAFCPKSWRSLHWKQAQTHSKRSMHSMQSVKLPEPRMTRGFATLQGHWHPLLADFGYFWINKSCGINPWMPNGHSGDHTLW